MSDKACNPFRCIEYDDDCFRRTGSIIKWRLSWVVYIYIYIQVSCLRRGLVQAYEMLDRSSTNHDVCLCSTTWILQRAIIPARRLQRNTIRYHPCIMILHPLSSRGYKFARIHHASKLIHPKTFWIPPTRNQPKRDSHARRRTIISYIPLEVLLGVEVALGPQVPVLQPRH